MDINSTQFQTQFAQYENTVKAQIGSKLPTCRNGCTKQDHMKRVALMVSASFLVTSAYFLLLGSLLAAPVLFTIAAVALAGSGVSLLVERTVLSRLDLGKTTTRKQFIQFNAQNKFGMVVKMLAAKKLTPRDVIDYKLLPTEATVKQYTAFDVVGRAYMQQLETTSKAKGQSIEFNPAFNQLDEAFKLLSGTGTLMLDDDDELLDPSKAAVMVPPPLYQKHEDDVDLIDLEEADDLDLISNPPSYRTEESGRSTPATPLIYG